MDEIHKEANSPEFQEILRRVWLQLLIIQCALIMGVLTFATVTIFVSGENMPDKADAAPVDLETRMAGADVDTGNRLFLYC